MTARSWPQAGSALLAKMIGEWCYEDLLAPEPAGTAGGWLLRFNDVRYEFCATRGAFGSWRVVPGSVRRVTDEIEHPADDPLRFAVEARHALGLDGITLSELLRELTATLAADVRLLARALPAAAVADLPYEQLESHQTGHPCLVLNKGRLGFSAGDAARYSPEAAQPLRLKWMAAAPELAHVAGIAPRHLVHHELDADTRDAFAGRLRAAAGHGDGRGYVWLPVHPFHWDEAVATLFAGEVASGSLVLLGESPDRYLPLQSIRTLTNLDRPERHDVKLPLLIRNTLVWRGLAADPTDAAPAVTAWLHERLANDAFLRDECRMVVLGEVASATVRHPLFDRIADAPYRYHELLGAVWRQPVRTYLEPGERARTMASLLHVGGDGRGLVAELVSRSGLDPDTWLRRFFEVLFAPLLHWLYQYGVAFCPHGENVVVVFDRNDVPVRIAIKDLAEDVNLVPERLPEHGDLPSEADAVLLRWRPDQLRHSILGAICAGHLRFLAPLVETQLGCREAHMWHLVRQVVDDHHRRFPELAERIHRFGILDPKVERICLNREQLAGGRFHDRSERDGSFDLTVGYVPNPLHAHG